MDAHDTFEPGARHGCEHDAKYLRHFVAQLAVTRGFRVRLEQASVTEASIDAVLEKGALSIGVGITVATDINCELAKLRESVTCACSRVAWIATEKRCREAIARGLSELCAPVPVEVLAPEEYPAFLERCDDAIVPTIDGRSVLVRHTPTSPEEARLRREAIAKVLARSLKGS
jgi:hypothetical protein